jgi:VWFA-related protein
MLRSRAFASASALAAGIALLAGDGHVRAQQQQQQQPPQQPATPATPQQQQPPQDQQPRLPTFRTGANIVRVDATVVDHNGNPVPSLSPDDFEVQEDGIAQQIQSFKFVEATGRPAADDDLSLTIRSPEHAAAEAARDDVRVFLIFWDEYHIDQFEAALRAREALGKFVTTAFGPTDLVAIMDPLTPVDAIRFTRTWSDLALEVKKLRGRFNVFVPTRSAAEDAQLERGSDVRRLRAEVSLSALKSAAVFLGSLREGRKAIIFISQGLRALGRDAPYLLGDTIRAANESNTAIYTVDPRGLNGAGVSDSLYDLAFNTGAKAIVNSNRLDAPLLQVVKEASAFYLLGYSSARNPADGRFHQIKVRVKRPGLEVRARKGYWAPSQTAITEAREKAIAAEVPDDIGRALATLTPSTARRLVDLWTGTARTTDGQPALTVAWAPHPVREHSEHPAALVVTGLDASGAAIFDARVEPSGASFPVTPGVMQLRVSVRDGEDQIIDSEVRTLTIPDYDEEHLAFSTPVVLRARTPLELRGLREDLNPAPFPGHEFSRGDRVLVRVSLYNDRGSEAAVSAKLKSRNGRVLVTLPVAPIPNRPGVYEIDFPIASVSVGDFVIALEAARGNERVETMVGIRVGG